MTEYVFELSDEQVAGTQVAMRRRSRWKAAYLIKLFLRHPTLLVHTLRLAWRGATAGVSNDHTLTWMFHLDAVRSVVPKAGLGAQWGGLESFLAILREYAKPTDNVLEIGCGGGRITTTIRPHVAELTAVDVSKWILAEARRASEGLDPIRYLVDKNFGQNLPSNTYQLAYSHDVFVHFEYDEVLRYLDSIRKSLVCNGKFIVSLYTVDSSEEFGIHTEQILEARNNPLRPFRV